LNYPFRETPASIEKGILRQEFLENITRESNSRQAVYRLTALTLPDTFARSSGTGFLSSPEVAFRLYCLKTRENNQEILIIRNFNHTFSNRN